MKAQGPLFVESRKQLKRTLEGLKNRACGFCGRVGALNRHDVIVGRDPASTTGQGTTMRGQRAYCCARGRRGGCGHTMAIVLADVLPRHAFTATWLWAVLRRWLDGQSLQKAWQKAGVPLDLSSLYHLVHRLRRRLSALRPWLCKRTATPADPSADPLRQTLHHLRSAFADEPCPVSAFQLHFQRAWMG